MASQFDGTHISHISGHVDHTFPVNLQLQGASRHLHKHLGIRKPQTVGRGRCRTAAAAGSQCVARSPFVHFGLDMGDVYKRQM